MILGRTLRAAAVIVTAASLTATSASALTAAPVSAGGPTGGPPTVTADDIRFAHPPKILRYGTAESVGLNPYYINRIATDIAGFLQPSPTYPQYAGAVAL